MNNRIEFSTHTIMSKTSIIKPNELIETAYEMGFKAIAVTDNNSCEIFPSLNKALIKFNEENDTNFKIIYGMCLSVVHNDIPFKVNLLVRNNDGLPWLYKLLSIANTKYLNKKGKRKLPVEFAFDKEKRVLTGLNLTQNKDIINVVLDSTNQQLLEMVSPYDYIMIEPINNLNYLIGEDKPFKDEIDAQEFIARVVAVVSKKKIVIVTGDVHHLKEEDLIYENILLNNDNLPSTHLKSDKEMLNEFSFLEKGTARNIVIDNTLKLANLISDVDTLLEGKINAYPDLDFCDTFNVGLVSLSNAKRMYALPLVNDDKIYERTLPEEIENRLVEEGNIILQKQSSFYYNIAQDVNSYSKNKYKIMSIPTRGLSSTFMAYILGISKVNPLKPHYHCPKCNYLKFSLECECGLDLPKKKCPKCNTSLINEGFNIPYELFLGCNDSKELDIALNVDFEMRREFADYLESYFGDDHIFRAGTIGLLKDKAINRTKKYFEERNISKTKAEIEEIASHLKDVKYTSGVYPFRYFIAPNSNEIIYNYTPIQYPADDKCFNDKSTHLKYNEISGIAAVDLIPNMNITWLKKIQELVDYNLDEIPMDDSKVLDVLLGKSSISTKGIPDFGSKFVIDLLEIIKPNTFNDLVSIIGFAHGNSTWNDNASMLFESGVELKDLIATRDDIYLSLIKYGLDKELSYLITEYVRKGKAKKGDMEWEMYKIEMQKKSVPEWFIDSCEKIDFLLYKSHCAELLLLAYKFAYVKVYDELVFYKTYLDINEDSSNEDILDEIKNREIIIEETMNKNAFVDKEEKIIFIYSPKEKIYEKIKEEVSYEKKVTITSLQKKYVLGINTAKEFIKRLIKDEVINNDGFVMVKPKAYFKVRGIDSVSDFDIKIEPKYKINNAYFKQMSANEIKKHLKNAFKHFDYNDYRYKGKIKTWIQKSSSNTYDLYVVSECVIQAPSNFDMFFKLNKTFDFSKAKIEFQNVNLDNVDNLDVINSFLER